jgi:SOS response regulatory protein OraA/RecX
VQFGNTGRRIVDVRIEKKQIKVVFDTHEICLVDEGLLADFYLYKEKVIDDKTFRLLQTASQKVPFKKYLYHVLSKGRYTESQIKAKLIQKKAPTNIAYDLILEAKKNHLIDDDALAKDLLEYYSSKPVGIKYIENQFKKKGFSKEIISTLTLPYNTQKESAKKQYDLLATKLNGKPYLARKQIVYRTLMNKGFDDSIIQVILDQVDKNDDSELLAKLKLHYDIARKKYEKKYKDWDLNSRIFNYLKTKGYNSKDIKTVLGELKHDLD